MEGSVICLEDYNILDDPVKVAKTFLALSSKSVPNIYLPVCPHSVWEISSQIVHSVLF